MKSALASKDGFLPSFESLLGSGAIRYEPDDPNQMINAIFGQKRPSTAQANKRYSMAAPTSVYDSLGAFSSGFPFPLPISTPYSTPALRDLGSRLDYADPLLAFTAVGRTLLLARAK